MHLEILTAVARLTRLAGRHLEHHGHRVAFVPPDASPPRTLLRLPPGVPEADVADLLALLMPLSIAVTIEPERRVARLELAMPAWAPEEQVRVVGPALHVDPLVALLRAVGVPATATPGPLAPVPLLRHAHLAPTASGLLAWLGRCQGHGFKIESAGSGATTTLHLGEPVLPRHQDGPRSLQAALFDDEAAMPGRPRPQPVRIYTDSPADAEVLRMRLDLLGFSPIDIEPLPDDPTHHRFVVTPPMALAPLRHPAWCRLLPAWLGVLQAAGVPIDVMPPLLVDVPPPRGTDIVAIDLGLPMAAWRRGELHPVLVGPGRFHIEVRAFERVLAEPACAALRLVGFVATAGRLTACEQDRLSRSHLHADALLDDPAALALVYAALQPLAVDLAAAPAVAGDDDLEALGSAVPGPPAPFATSRIRSLGLTARLDLLPPFVVADPARRIRTALQRFQVTLHIDDQPAMRPLREALATWADSSIRARSSMGNPRAVIQFGGAPEALMQELAAELERVLGVPFELDNCWGPDDTDIWVHVPQPAPVQLADEPDPFDEAWGRPLARGEDGLPLARKAFLELHDTWLRVGPVRLPRRVGPRHPLAPAADTLDRMCLDTGTARLLVDLASAAQANEPCLLEGPTSATKTSGILLLASLLGQPVLRLNLSSQTDTSELVGQYVPDPTGGFRWQDGAAVRAAQEGWWLVIDEINLGPPQVVERLNSLLEQPPMLTLAERDHRVLGTTDQPIHPDFRLFATMNPAGYAGRSALSPAGKDRWLRQIQVPTPDEAAIEAMLRHAVWGEQPQVRDYGSGVHDPQHLASTPGFVAAPIAADAVALDDFVMRLAKFHASVLTAGEPQPLGASRQEPYVFTRRGLLALVQRVRREIAGGTVLDDALRAGLRQAYVDRVAACDRPALGLLMDAVGLGPREWQVGEAGLFGAGRTRPVAPVLAAGEMS